MIPANFFIEIPIWVSYCYVFIFWPQVAKLINAWGVGICLPVLEHFPIQKGDGKKKYLEQQEVQQEEAGEKNGPKAFQTIGRIQRALLVIRGMMLNRRMVPLLLPLT